MSTSNEERYVDWDLGGHSPAKYPTFKTSKRKPKKVPEEPKRKARKNLTLEIPMREVPPWWIPRESSRKYTCRKKGKYSILINSWINWINTPPNPSYVLVT